MAAEREWYVLTDVGTVSVTSSIDLLTARKAPHVACAVSGGRLKGSGDLQRPGQEGHVLCTVIFRIDPLVKDEKATLSVDAAARSETLLEAAACVDDQD